MMLSVRIRVGREVRRGQSTSGEVRGSMHILGPWSSICMALGDALRMDFAVAFLELWLRMISLELWLKIEGKHETFLELWLKMTSLELWLGTANGHAHSLSCGSGWRRLPV
ncbi:hypothetical protein DEO72_LG6g746 [Vigna unguiculata]|uniref:Uncharacterized protein n=1 Tax=Vigna unguiculata TaxID=3917 RepID=A0A4D6M859_VIGUN|nr:hypothetical protein DEO72_LG6g746 [Vigna unguiculata]